MNKITLITPPDFYENSNPSILLIGLDNTQQDECTEWLGKNDLSPNINLYYYQDENNVEWLMYALARADMTFINIDANITVSPLFAYLLSRPNVYYSTTNDNLRQLFAHINGHFVNNINDFFEGIKDE